MHKLLKALKEYKYNKCLTQISHKIEEKSYHCKYISLFPQPYETINGKAAF